MKTQLKLISIYFSILSFFNTKLAGTIAIRLFMKTRRQRMSKRERAFYEKAHHFITQSENKIYHCYELGDTNSKLVFLVHGWNSNAGSMAGIADLLVSKGYHVISLDLPAHGLDPGKYTNLFESKEALKAVIGHLWPSEPFSIVSHSFGSMVSAFALSELTFRTDKVVFLTCPNSLEGIFRDYQKLFSINEKVYGNMVEFVNKLFDSPISQLNVVNRIRDISYSSIDIIHDRKDKVVPFRDSIEIKEKTKNASLHEFSRTGHYRMLWNQEIQELIISIFEGVTSEESLVSKKRELYV